MNLANSTIYVGIVDSVTLDQDGCLGVSIPAMNGTFKARFATQMAGKDRGVLFLPERNDQVLVASVIGADVRFAIIGSLWSRNAEAPGGDEGDTNNLKVIKTRGGSVIEFNDEEGAEHIRISDRDGKNKLVISSAGDDKGFVVESSEGKVSITADTINLNGNVNVSKILTVGDKSANTSIDKNNITGTGA